MHRPLKMFRSDIIKATRKKPKIRKRNFIIRESFRVMSTTHDRTRKCAHEVFVVLFRTDMKGLSKKISTAITATQEQTHRGRQKREREKRGIKKH